MGREGYWVVFELALRLRLSHAELDNDKDADGEGVDPLGNKVKHMLCKCNYNSTFELCMVNRTAFNMCLDTSMQRYAMIRPMYTVMTSARLSFFLNCIVITGERNWCDWKRKRQR